MRETILQAKIRAELNKAGSCARLWRNNNGAYELPSGKWLKYGLGPGSADLVGIRKVTITQEMVGKIVGVFVGIEIKTEDGIVSNEQLAWQKVIRAFGGVSEIIRSVNDARQWLNGRT